ncbi:protein odr-4 homolog isoform X3 [Xenopus tropicalis]|uniref:Protein odr-4 homolog n=1 Tax=Xenopus tropicalis TaxID=8364 RepID=A0A8J0T0K6_XENTR|nr:protein odr-4 homolog isoform X3 [Xenopus tropicalis]
MGRSYYVDDGVEKYFSKLIQQQKAYVTGLLIGQYSSQRDYAVLAAQTPQKEDQSEETKSGFSKLEGIDDEWVSMHASQLGHMLPGGLMVLGVFLMTSPDLSKDSQNVLRKLVFTVEKSSMKNRLWNFDDDDVSERVTLHICSATKKITCRTYDINDPKLGLVKWAKEIEDSLVLFNGQVKDKSADLFEEQKKSSRSSSHYSPQIITANVLTAAPLIDSTRSTALVQPCKSSLTIQGVVKCCGYIHSNRPKVKDALQAVKRDILNTIQARCEMLFEDMMLNGPSKGTENEVCPLPQRVFVPINGSSLKLCDYLFGDETSSDLQSHFLEIMDQEVEQNELEFPEKKCSCTQPEERESEPVSYNLESKPVDQANSSSKFLLNKGLLISTVVASIAVIISFYYII